MLCVGGRIRVSAAELRYTFVKSGGPGGQNVNKVASKAVLRWNVAASAGLPDDVRERFAQRYAARLTAGGEIVLTSDRHRDQRRNAAECREKLRAMLAVVAEPPKPRRRTRPGRAAVQRRLTAKRQAARTKRMRRPPSAED
jgi:ribosome-associated protein